MASNFTQAPYFDDFSPNKNFHRILFKPGYAVQARELTQAQTILQDQISKFASSIFSQNTPISGGKITTNLTCNFIKLNATYQGSPITAGQFLNKLISDSTGSILAKVIATSETTSNGAIAGDPPTLIVNYLSGTQFSDSMTIFPTDGSNFAATTIGISGGATSIGSASVVSISDGVFYVVNGYNTAISNDGSTSKYSIGNFVNVISQTVVLDKYDSSPSYRVGLQITESINDYIDDNSLLDPAIGASNYQAPGADRYTITLTLTTLPLTVGNDDGFIELLRIQNGVILKQVDSTVYSTIDDYFAKRTYDTNGDYIVNPFRLTPSTNSTDVTKYDLSIGKGVAYVQGYRAENQSPFVITSDRSRTTDSIIGNDLSIDYGNYFYVTNVLGSASGRFQITLMQPVDFHIATSANVVTSNSATYTSTVAATGRIRNLNYYGTTGANTSSYIYKAAVCDIVTNTLSGNVTVGTSTTIQTSDVSFSTSANVYNNVYLTIDSGSSAGDTRKIVSYSGSTKTFTVDTPFSTNPTNTSKFSLRFQIKDIESIIVANSTFSISSSSDISTVSKVNQLTTGDTVLQDTGYPELIFKLGNPYISNVTNSTFQSTDYFRNIQFNSPGCAFTLSLTGADATVLRFNGGAGVLTQDEVLSYYTVIVRAIGSNSGLVVGQILDMTYPGRSITLNSTSTTATFNAPDLSAATAFVVDVIAKVSVNQADNSSHVLRTKTLTTANYSVVTNTSGTQINTYTYVDTTNAQVYIQNAGIVSKGSNQSLYIADVKRISKIIDTGSSATIPTLGMLSTSSYDVTANYTFNTGQTDSHYDHAYITLKYNAPAPTGNLLILFDYYVHGGGDGYLSINSYVNESYIQIPYYTATNGILYSLRDSLDFRPVRLNATTAQTFRYTNSNLTTTDAGSYLPDNLSQHICNYSYYLGRKDLLILTKDKNFQIIEGAPAIQPILPIQPDGSLLIAKLALDPYTAYVPGENPVGSLPNLSIEMIQHKRWTMQDISDLQTRINNLEYYTALTALEQNAASTQISDVNGLNRFKNGILVDDFSSFSTADTGNLDWSASINKRTRQLTASQTVSNYPLQYLTSLNAIGNLSSVSGLSIHNIDKTTNIYTLPYTSINCITQQLASNTINLNPFSVSSTQGTLFLNPPMDNWVDNSVTPSLLLVDPTLQVFQQSNTVNVLSAGDWKTVVGTSTLTAINRVPGLRPRQPIVTASSTTTTAYTTSTQTTTTLGNYQNINNSYNITNNYITDISIIPYIRPQEILIKAKELLINSPVTTTFDGQNVDMYMYQPDIIELSNVNGKFQENDIIGYTDINVFYPIATVVSVYNYPNTSNTRLYVTGNFHSSYYSSLSNTQFTIQTAKYDYTTSTISHPTTATTTTPQIVNVHLSGTISKVGTYYVDNDGGHRTPYFANVPSNFGNFALKYGIWGLPNLLKSSNVITKTGTVNFYAPKTGTYYLRYAHASSLMGYIKINGTYVVGSSNTSTLIATNGTTIPISLTLGTNVIDIHADNTNASANSIAFVAAAVTTTSTWTGATPAFDITPSAILFSTRNIVGSSVDTTSGTQVVMTGANQNQVGGLYFINATTVALSGLASNVDGYYNGCTINFTSTKVISTYDPGDADRDADDRVLTPSTKTFSTIITNYSANGKICTLQNPVELSLGFNHELNADISSTYTIVGTHTNYINAVTNGVSNTNITTVSGGGNTGLASHINSGGVLQLSTDESGTFVGIFRVPSNMFHTGDRVFRVDNRTTITDPNSATSYAEGTFYASGLSTKSQSLNFSPATSAATTTFTSTSAKTTQKIATTAVATPQNTRTYRPNKDPVAQSFIVDSIAYPNGAFLDSVDFFFQSKPTLTNDPVKLTIVPTINGYPGGDVLDYSTVILTPDLINVSSTPHYLDPSAITTFKFSAPVYVQADVLYAFILKSSSADYNVYLAAQNSIALPSTVKANYIDITPTTLTKIGAVPGFGGIFESQNGMTWTADQSKTLMMNLKSCSFDTSSSAIIPFAIPTNAPSRKSVSGDINYLLNPNNTSYISNKMSGGDILCDAFNMTTTDFTPSATGITYSYVSTYASSLTSTPATIVSPGKFACPTYDDIYLSDGLGERTIIASSSNSFVLSATLTSTDSTVSPIISDDGISLYNIQWNINNLSLANSLIVVANTGSGYIDAPNTIVTISAPDISGGSQAYASPVITSNTISSIYLTNSGSGYLSAPKITISGANTTQANVYVISEFSSHGGNAACKYFTKKVIMTPGNDSQDLRVYYTAYRPIGTNIYVFYKLLNDNDPTLFDNNGWQLMTNIGQNKNVYSISRDDLYEFEAGPGVNGVANNYINYVNASGQSYTSFIQFALKVVLTTDDNTTVPYLSDIRCLALPSGTGL